MDLTCNLLAAELQKSGTPRQLVYPSSLLHFLRSFCRAKDDFSVGLVIAITSHQFYVVEEFLKLGADVNQTICFVPANSTDLGPLPLSILAQVGEGKHPWLILGQVGIVWPV